MDSARHLDRALSGVGKVSIASPSYCAEMRRAHAKRIAREECQRTINEAYRVLGDAEAEADRAYMAEMNAINAGLGHFERRAA